MYSIYNLANRTILCLTKKKKKPYYFRSLIFRVQTVVKPLAEMDCLVLAPNLFVSLKALESGQENVGCLEFCIGISVHSMSVFLPLNVDDHCCDLIALGML